MRSRSTRGGSRPGGRARSKAVQVSVLHAYTSGRGEEQTLYFKFFAFLGKSQVLGQTVHRRSTRPFCRGQSGPSPNLEGSCDETNAGYLPCRDFLACTLACSLVSYRPLARLGLTRQKRAVAPRAGDASLGSCTRRVITRRRRGQTPSCCSAPPPQPLPPQTASASVSAAVAPHATASSRAMAAKKQVGKYDPVLESRIDGVGRLKFDFHTGTRSAGR